MSSLATPSSIIAADLPVSKSVVMATPGTLIYRKIINTAKAPKAIGPYNQAIVVDRTVYLSGQIGIDPQTGELVSEDVVQQAKQVLTNLTNVLEAAGSSLNNVVKTTVLLADLKDYTSVNDVYSQFFVNNTPARAAFQAAALPKGAKVEIEAVAMVGKIIDE